MANNQDKKETIAELRNAGYTAKEIRRKTGFRAAEIQSVIQEMANIDVQLVGDLEFSGMSVTIEKLIENEEPFEKAIVTIGESSYQALFLPFIAEGRFVCRVAFGKKNHPNLANKQSTINRICRIASEKILASIPPA